MKTCTIAADLYWTLPGPRKFIGQVAECAGVARLLWVNLPFEPIPGLWEGVKTGLKHAHIDRVVELIIRDGTDIAADIGFHLSLRRVTAGELILCEAPCRTAFILRAEGAKGTANCHAYATAFLESVGKGGGNVLLVVSGHEAKLVETAAKGELGVVSFDGGLSPDEMDAYVSIRMLDRSGPGSTRLTRSIVSEFAGFDVEVAEQLMQFDESQLVSVIDHLGVLLDEGAVRWKDDSWLARTRSTTAPGTTHLLHDYFLSKHGSSEVREHAAKRISARYWRACVKTLTPWLEERRLKVIGFFAPQIGKIAAANNGKIPKPIGTNRVVMVGPAELEYNNVVGMSGAGAIMTATAEEQAALTVCKLAKYVRDDIAHLRMPAVTDIVRLIVEMDRLLAGP